jgi:prevent-host-death family protein
MHTSTTAANANRNFSSLLAEVKGGRTVTITSHGQPVARMVPLGAGSSITGAARKALFSRLRGGRLQQADRWTRDDLYEESR